METYDMETTIWRAWIWRSMDMETQGWRSPLAYGEDRGHRGVEDGGPP